MNLKSNKLFLHFKNSKFFSLKQENYFNIYVDLFKKYKNKKITLVEIGIANGGSLYMWRSFFGKKARIIGVDLNPEVKKFEKDGFEIFVGDQSDKKFWKILYRKIGKIDILIDDGGHKNIQQVVTVAESINNIKDNGMIVIEDTVTSYMKKKGFNNPSRYSFINYCNLIIESIHRRNSLLNKKNNIYSKKVNSIKFYDSLVVLNIKDTIKEKSNSISNMKKNTFFVDFRHESYFLKTLNYFPFFSKNKFIFKIIRKIFHRNIFFYIHEKIKLLSYFNKIKS